MENKTSWRRRLLAPLLAATALVVPLGFSGASNLTVGTACAQTGTCVLNQNTCFVNGNPYPGTWVEGSS
jgi:hypothetical protein